MHAEFECVPGYGVGGELGYDCIGIFIYPQILSVYSACMNFVGVWLCRVFVDPPLVLIGICAIRLCNP